MNLRETFKNDFSSSAFKTIDGETRIVGKWGQVSILGDYFDIWLVKPNLEPLSSRKITAMLKNSPLDEGFRVLDGEAYTQVRGAAAVRYIAPILGIKKRRNISEDQRRKLAEQLARARDARV